MKKNTINKNLVAVCIFAFIAVIVGTFFMNWGSKKATGLEDSLEINIPTVVEDFAKENYKNAIDTLNLVSAGSASLGKAYRVYSYPIVADSNELYHYPIVEYGKIRGIYTVIYNTETKTCYESFGEGEDGMRDWLNSIDYLKHDYLLYSINHGHDVEIAIAEDTFGNQFYLDESMKDQLTDEEQDFIELSISEKLSEFTRNKKVAAK